VLFPLAGIPINTIFDLLCDIIFLTG